MKPFYLNRRADPIRPSKYLPPHFIYAWASLGAGGWLGAHAPTVGALDPQAPGSAAGHVALATPLPQGSPRHR